MKQNAMNEVGRDAVDRLSFVIDSAGVGTWDWDILTGDLVWSERSLEMFGLAPDSKMTYERFIQALHPEDRERIDHAVKHTLETKKKYDVEMRAVWPDGSIHWVASRGQAYFDESGRAVRMSGIALDIAKAKETEEELERARAAARAKAEEFSALVDAVPALAFFSQDPKCEYMAASHYAHEVFSLPYGTNLSMSAPNGERPNVVYYEDGRPLQAEELPMQQAASTGRVFRNKELEIRYPDGHSVYILGNAVPLLDEAGKPRGAVGAFLDVTERKRIEEELRLDIRDRKAVEEALRQQRERFEFVSEGSDVGFWFCDLPFDKVIWDKRVKNHFWLPPDDSPVTMDLFYSLLHPEDREPTRKAIENSIENNQQYDVEYRTVAPDGREKWIRAIGRTFYDEAGRPRRFDGITVDITARKHAENARIASEQRLRELAENLDREVQARTAELEARNEQIMHAAAGLKHLSGRLLQIQDEERRKVARDLHDSAGQIVTALDLELGSLAEATRKGPPHLQKIIESSQQLVQQLHREIRTTSYLLHPPLLDEAGLNSGLSWYVQGLSQRSGIGIQLDISEGFGRLPRDLELAIFRLVQESLTNIHRHSGSKTAEIHLIRGEETVYVEIQDTGKGIAPGALRKILGGGSGVGICGMRERLRQFGSELQIESSERGTRVFVTIPIAKESGSERGMDAVRAVS